MDSIPDAWPPHPEDAGVLTAPLFPLPDVWLFPRVVMPLHIFEPRYRDMIEDSMDGPGRIVMGTIVPGHEEDMPASPPVHAIAGVGEILRHDKTEDGRFVIQLLGLERVSVTEVKSDKAYRRVAYEPLPEAPVTDEDDEELRPLVLAAIRRRIPDQQELPEEAPLGILADVLLVLLIRMKLSHEALQTLYAQTDPAERARGALSADAVMGLEAFVDDEPDADDGGDDQSGESESSQ